jgi:hypothetical protein
MKILLHNSSPPEPALHRVVVLDEDSLGSQEES